MGLLKSYSTQCAQDTARDAVQIFGGRGITKTGMGKFIEHVSRTSVPCYWNKLICFHSTIERSRLTRFLEEVSGDILLRYL